MDLKIHFARLFRLAASGSGVDNAGDMNTLIERIDARLAELGISRSRASLMAGLNVKFILSIAKHPNRSPRAENLEALAKVLSVPVEWLIRGDSESESTGERAMYLGGLSLGSSAPVSNLDSQPASRISDGILSSQSERDALIGGGRGIPVLSGRILTAEVSKSVTNAVEYIDVSERFGRIRDVFALYVEDEAMSPAYRAGDLIVLHPGRPPRSGDDAVFVMSGGSERDGEGSNHTGGVVIASIVSVGGEEYQLRQHSPVRDFSLTRSEIEAAFFVMAVLRG